MEALKILSEIELILTCLRDIGSFLCEQAFCAGSTLKNFKKEPIE